MGNSKKIKELKIVQDHLHEKAQKKNITPKQQANLTTLLIKMEKAAKNKANGKRQN